MGLLRDADAIGYLTVRDCTIVKVRDRLKLFLSVNLREVSGDGEEYSRGWVDLGSVVVV